MFELELGWDRPARSGPGPSAHLLRVRVRPLQETCEASGLPLRLAIAVDTSSSMDGSPLAHARAGCLALLAQLRPVDRFSLAGFADHVTPLMESAAGGSESERSGGRAVAGLVARGVTRTDLALDWMLRALPPEPGTVRMGVLVTDGHPTDAAGQPLDDLSELLYRSESIACEGATVCTVGLGDASNFNTSLLVDLSDRGRGAFLYADTPDALEPLLRARLAVGQSVSANDPRLFVRRLLPGTVLKSACLLRPEFLPLEIQPAADGDSTIPLGGVRGDAPTDILIAVEAPPAGLADRPGHRAILSAHLEGVTPEPPEVEARLLYTDSYVEAQQMDREIYNDRLQWDLNVYSQALNRSVNAKQTAALLGDIAHVAGKAGRKELAIKATGQLMELQESGRLDAHKATGMLVQTRQPKETT